MRRKSDFVLFFRDHLHLKISVLTPNTENIVASKRIPVHSSMYAFRYKPEVLTTCKVQSVTRKSNVLSNFRFFSTKIIREGVPFVRIPFGPWRAFILFPALHVLFSRTLQGMGKRVLVGSTLPELDSALSRLNLSELSILHALKRIEHINKFLVISIVPIRMELALHVNRTLNFVC